MVGAVEESADGPVEAIVAGAFPLQFNGVDGLAAQAVVWLQEVVALEQLQSGGLAITA